MGRIFNVTFSARDPLRLGTFWNEAAGYDVAYAEPHLVRLRNEGRQSNGIECVGGEP